MNLENVTYDAFISYRHCELDKFVAENLHKQLEAFKVPKALITAGKTNGKTKIERVFRDRDELPLASNLADPITIALEKSDYLIVICSPRLPESKWCLKEIETFISMHGREHILAVLIEGEPIDSFPEILRFEERTVTDENGSTHTEKVEVEPLAADVRGKDKKEILKQIKSELLRLAAPMLGCNYDDLKMRHKEARQKKILRISLGVSLVCLIFTAISTTMALTIHRQSDTISEQYTKALENQAISYASTSQTLLSEEDRMAAMAIARLALPDDMSLQTEKPYTPSAEYALSDSMGIYNNGRSYYPVKTLEQTSPIKIMKVSPDESTITTVDTNNQITIFDVASASILTSYTMSEEYDLILNEASIAYLGNDKIVYTATGGFCIYDIPSKQETFIKSEDSPSYIKCSSDGSYIGTSNYSSLQIFDKEGNALFSYNLPENFIGDQAMAFDADKKLLAFSAVNITDEEEKGLIGLVDMNKMEIIYTTEVESSSFVQASYLKDQVIFAGNSFHRQNDNPLDVRTTAYLYSFPLDKDECNWTYAKEDELIQYFTGSLEWESNSIVYAGSAGVEFINAANGSYLSAYDTGNKVIDIAPLKSDSYIYALTEDGEKILIAGNNLINTVIEEYDTSNGTFADYSFTFTFDAGFRKNATSVNIYQKMTSDKAKTLTAFESSISDSVYSEQQKALLIRDYNGTIYIYRTEDNTFSPITETEDEMPEIFFTGTDDEQFGILYQDTLVLYNSQTGEQTESISLQDTLDDIVYLSFIDISEDKNMLAYYNSYNATVYIYSIADRCTTSIPLAEGTQIPADAIGFNEDFSQFALASTTDNTLALYETESGKEIQKCDINASLVTNIILSKEAGCMMITNLDNSVTVYNLTDLSTMHTYTNFATSVKKLDRLNIKKNEADSPVPMYAVYGSYDCYLLNEDLEPVAHLYEYVAFDQENQQFFLSCKESLLTVPYYTYDMLIKEADTLLEDYQLSDYRKNQLGIQIK